MLNVQNIKPAHHNGQQSQSQAAKRGYEIKNRLSGFYHNALTKQPKANEPKAIRPGILIAVVAAFAFMFLTLLSSTSESSNEIRQRIPELRERYVAYVTATHSNDSRTLIDQRWPLLERCLEDIAHYSQQQDPRQVRVKVDELLSLERDARSPVYQFGLELRKQLPPE